MDTYNETNDPIKRVVLLMMENHSFDQMLGSLAPFHPSKDGVPGLDGIPEEASPRSNADADGNVYYQRRTCALQMELDPDHDNKPVLEQIKDTNSGFIKSFVTAHPGSTKAQRQQVMDFYEFPFLPALHTLADNFLVCDRWFSSLPGPTWPNRFFALSGTSHGQVRMPESLRDPDFKAFFEQTQVTLFDRLNEAGQEWKIYFYDIASSWILVNQRKPENLARYWTIDHFFVDAAKKDGLPPFVFIEPKYFGQDQNDDHPPHNVMKGEKLIADVYNAIRSSPDWKETLLVVVFDEHGGFYDHVPPPTAQPPDDFGKLFDFRQLGVRVPAILISPWLARGVDHTIFDHTSLLKYLTGKWNLGELGGRVAAATSIAEAMRFLRVPRTDTVPTIRVRNSDLYAPRPDLELFDRNRHHHAFAVFGDYLASLQAQQQLKTPFVGWTRIAIKVIGAFLGTRWRAFTGFIGRRLVRWGVALGTSKESVAAEIGRITKHL